jgi:D-xylose transport system substrate-binding protein
MNRAARLIPLAATAAALVVAGCGSSDDNSSSKSGSSSSGTATAAAKPSGSVGVLLPDSKSSVRWETVDRPFLKKAFEDAGIKVDIENAEGDKATQQQQAEQMITNGAKVLLEVNLDSGSGAAIEAAAAAKGVKTIDYDRLTLGGDADYYVTFDGGKVGELQANSLESCMTSAGSGKNIVFLNGSPTDNNATLFKGGAHKILDPKISDGTYKKVAEQDVPDWDNQKALTIFEQMLQKTGNKIDGVLAANDGLGNAAISALKARKLKQIPVTGQDATLQGLQNILTGDQCMSVYKPTTQEAGTAAKIAIALIKGTKPDVQTTMTNNQKKDVPTVLLAPIAITKDNIKDYTSQPDFPKPADICAGKLASACSSAGIQ